MIQPTSIAFISDLVERGDFLTAERLCRQELEYDHRNPAVLNLWAIILAHNGKVNEAIHAARLAVQEDETNPTYHLTLGNLLRLSGRLTDAILELRQAIEISPSLAEAHLRLGEAYAAVNSPSAAEDAYRQALTLRPDYMEALLLLGRLYLANGRTEESIEIAQQAIGLHPGSLASYLLLGDALASKGDNEAAFATYKQATEVAASSVESWCVFARACHALGKFEEAEAAYKRGLSISPNHGDCLFGLTKLLEQALCFEAATSAARHFLCIHPDNPEALKCLGRLLLAQGYMPEAYHLIRRALELLPNDADTYYGFGNVSMRMLKLDEGLAAYRRSISLAPESPKARFAEASPLLMQGSFATGWLAYEARLDIPGVPWKVKNVRERLWNGSKIGQRKLLVHTEQGYGDTFQFIRYLPLIRKQVGPEAQIEVLCEPEIEALVKTVGGFDKLHAPSQLGSIEYDLQVPLLTLPLLFGTTLDTIPSKVPYIGLPKNIHVPVQRAVGTTLTVAFTWAGRNTHSDDLMRSCPLKQFASLFELEDIQFISVQVGAKSSEIEQFLERPNVTSLSSELVDFAHTLSILDQVDLVVAVDTSVAHLAAAYGKPVWVLLSFSGEWRWLIRREDSPWYPSVRLFRQRILNDWTDVFNRVRLELMQLRGGKV